MNAFLYPAAELSDDTMLAHVRFSTRIRNALEFGGLKTVGEVRAASDAVLLSFQDLGKGSLGHLRETLGLYAEERLQVRWRGGRKRALVTRAPLTLPQRPNQRWSQDFVSDTLTDSRRFRILPIMDDITRECIALVAE